MLAPKLEEDELLELEEDELLELEDEELLELDDELLELDDVELLELEEIELLDELLSDPPGPPQPPSAIAANSNTDRINPNPTAVFLDENGSKNRCFIIVLSVELH